MQEKFIEKSLKLINAEQGMFVACVSTDNVDSVNDVIIQEGIAFKTLPLPFLYEHNTQNNWVLGFITQSYIKDNKMMVEGYYDLKDELNSGLTKEEKFAKYETAKQGMDKLSIGLSYTESDIELKNNITIIKRCVISEVSQVKNPANPYTFFQEVKSMNILDNVQKLNNILSNLYTKEREFANQQEQQVKMERKKTIKAIYDCIENADKLSDVKKSIRTLKELYAIKPDDLTTKMFRFFQKKYLTSKKVVDVLKKDEMSGGDMPSTNTDNLSVSEAETQKSQQINKSDPNLKSFDKLLRLYSLQKKQ
jgi:hypothetical protein